MSHFTVLVLLKKGETEAVIEGRMAPYSENRKVNPYEEGCYCVGSIARSAAHDTADEGGTTIDDLRKSYWRTHTPETASAEAWEARRDAAERAHPMYNKADPNCDECSGSGVCLTTRNPLGKWDYFRVGGRWDGVLTSNPQKSENGFNFDKRHESILNNSCAVTAIPADFSSFAVVTPDGEWHEKGRMGWWACVSDEKADWPVTFRDLMAKHADCTAVLLDCHT